MSEELQQLRILSAKVGSNPLLVQAAGGNTSIKLGSTMWIKASGTWLRDAAAKDIFVPLDLAHLAAVLAADDPACESCVDFVRHDLNPLGLRPSIETSVHGMMPQRVVVHVHCVNTIAHAIQQNGEALIGQRLGGFDWAWVPYARPGLMLARAIKKAMQPGVDVLVLGNHGLVVAADTVDAVEALLHRVVEAVSLPVQAFAEPHVTALELLAANSDYQLPQDVGCHAIAMDPWACAHGCNTVYYPDHVVFLGARIPSELSSGAAAIAISGQGVLVRKGAKASVEPMLRCIGDVFRRLPPNATLNPLIAEHIDQLLNWDAEKYRQSLKAT